MLYSYFIISAKRNMHFLFYCISIQKHVIGVITMQIYPITSPCPLSILIPLEMPWNGLHVRPIVSKPQDATSGFWMKTLATAMHFPIHGTHPFYTQGPSTILDWLIVTCVSYASISMWSVWKKTEVLYFTCTCIKTIYIYIHTALETCAIPELHCGNGNCFTQDNWCDDNDDCGNGSDEIFC